MGLSRIGWSSCRYWHRCFCWQAKVNERHALFSPEKRSQNLREMMRLCIQTAKSWLQIDRAGRGTGKRKKIRKTFEMGFDTAMHRNRGWAGAANNVWRCKANRNPIIYAIFPQAHRPCLCVGIVQSGWCLFHCALRDLIGLGRLAVNGGLPHWQSFDRKLGTYNPIRAASELHSRK